MTSTPWAERFTAYLADVEAYIAQHGHLPAPNQATPRTDKPRLQRMLASDRVDAAVKVRIIAVLAAPSWQQRRKHGITPAKVSRLEAYLSGIESYVAVHGHRPSSGKDAQPRMKTTWLRQYLLSATTDAATRDRITALLNRPSYQARSAHSISVRTRLDVVTTQMAALAEAAETLPGLSTGQAATLAWILQHRRLPSPGSSNRDERILGTRLATSLRSALAGTAKINTARFVLAVPNLATGADRDKISTLAEGREAARQESLRVAEASKTRLGSLEDRWNDGFAELTSWVEAHGALPRRRTFDSEEFRVANWLNVQRVQFRADNLDADLVGQLRTVPGALDPRAQLRGDLAFARTVADFHTAQGRLPRAEVPAPEGTVGIRLGKLRAKVRAGTIDPGALEVLTTVPGALNGRSLRKSPRQRLADLEAYVRDTGEFPVKGVEGLSNWAYRALRGEGSRSLDPAEAKEIQSRVKELRASARYVHVQNPDKLRAYLDALEGYIQRYGHLPTASEDADLRMNRTRLKAGLNSPRTDDITRARIRAVLAAAPYRRAAA